MQAIFRVFVDWESGQDLGIDGLVTQELRAGCPEDIDRICNQLTRLSVFTMRVIREDVARSPQLEVLVESNRALVFFLDIEHGIKLCSRNETCTQRDIVSLRNDDYPMLADDHIEVEQRDLISKEKAIAILRHYLDTGEVIDLVPWPPDDWDDKLPDEEAQRLWQQQQEPIQPGDILF
jgi:hypothetical protein